jgi:drug/metabolite transporter (DMT)-like permease
MFAPPPRRLQIAAAYAAVCVIWGSTYFAVRVALESWPPFFLGAARFLLAGGSLYALARARGEPAPRAKEWGSALVVGVLFFVAGNGLINVAERSVSSGLASILVSTLPLWTTVFARASGQRVSNAEVGGVLLGLAGVAVLNVGGELRASPAGAALALLAPMAWALGSIAAQRLPLPRGAMGTAAPMLCGGVELLLIGAGAGEHLSRAPSAASTVAVAYLTVFGSLVGFSAYMLLLKHTRPAVATSYAYVNPVIAVLLGVTFAGERFGATSLMGSAIVLAAVVLVGVARTRRLRPEPAIDDEAKETREAA